MAEVRRGDARPRSAGGEPEAVAQGREAVGELELVALAAAEELDPGHPSSAADSIASSVLTSPGEQRESAGSKASRWTYMHPSSANQ